MYIKNETQLGCNFTFFQYYLIWKMDIKTMKLYNSFLEVPRPTYGAKRKKRKTIITFRLNLF